MLGLFQAMLAAIVLPSSVTPLTLLFVSVAPLMTGCDARSMLTAAWLLFRKVSPVSVGLLPWMRTPAPLEVWMMLLVKETVALWRMTSAATPWPPSRMSMWLSVPLLPELNRKPDH